MHAPYIPAITGTLQFYILVKDYCHFKIKLYMTIDSLALSV